MSPFALPQEYAPMEARLVKEIPTGDGWQYEPKWDGFRALAFRRGDDVVLQSKSGQPLARYFPEVIERLRHIDAADFILDGELVVPRGGALSFDDLLLRIHPAASRVQSLARSSPATYLVFDLLALDAQALVAKPLRDRRGVLERFASAHLRGDDIRLSPSTQDRSVVQAWYAATGGALDGIIAKRLDLPYASGTRDGMVKVKQAKTADCVVAGYRLSDSGQAVASLLLGLYDRDGALDHVGFTSGFTTAERTALLGELQPLESDASFNKRIPGGPSRWNRGKSEAWQPLWPELVLEVGYDQVSGLRFRHGTKPLRWRKDKLPRACTIDQIEPDGGTLRLFEA